MKNQHEPDWLRSVHHDGSARYVSDPTPRLGDHVTLRIRVAAEAPVKRVLLRTLPDGEQRLTPMTPDTITGPARWWTISLTIDEPVVHYRFVLEADGGVWHLSGAGMSLAVPLDMTDFRLLADYQPPSWVNGAVFYQIFIDRFARGTVSGANGDEPAEHLPDWGASPPPDRPFPYVFYGGNLPGIIDQLDYLSDLGINALYLNPIFTAPSNHKYDVADFHEVDPAFGGNRALEALRTSLTEKQMRYVLDIVPNHCGVQHGWFQTALADANAPEAEFFTFNRHPDDYATWLGVRSLPKLNYQSLELRRRMYLSEESIIRDWLRPPYSADGWRVDVANMLARQGPSQLGVEISRGMREAVKAVQPDAYLLGENFFDATAQLQGDQWDGVMNYSGFTHPLWFWLAGYRQGAHGLPEPVSGDHWPTEAMTTTWRNHLATIPWIIALQQYNIVDSHDTPRIRTIVGGNDALHRLAVTVQMTYPGVPGLYYGDEIGLEDTPELHQRGCMPWDPASWDSDLLTFYRRLIHLRRSVSALQTGGFQLLLVEEETICYQREDKTSRVLVVAHRVASPLTTLFIPAAAGGIADGTRFREYLSGDVAVAESGVLALGQVRQGATVWVQDSHEDDAT